EKMFDPFFTTKELGKGTGLGLSTVLGIVKSPGGAVSAKSSAAGTTFQVLLPAASDAGALVQAADGGPEIPTGHGETILIVDDETAIRDIAQVLLTKSGYKVLVADDGPAALAAYAQAQGEIALVVIDFLMPVMNGLVLARIIRKMNPHAKVILSTGREEDCGAAELVGIGIAAALTKPYTKVTLLRTIARVLQGGGFES
ncbi:MAG TPA: response regulator, partial [Chthoniobacterales bacterium]|nr:response regulator [Chthoniobacterales bacterium]